MAKKKAKASSKASRRGRKTAAAAAPAVDPYEWLSLLSQPALQALIRAARSAMAGPAVPEGVVAAATTAVLAAPVSASSALSTRLSASDAGSAEDLEEMPLDVSTDMDPRLQLAIANHRAGKPAFGLASTTDDELPVIARVASAKAWADLPDVFAGSTLGKTADGDVIVTGRVPIKRMEDVRKAASVRSLKASQPIHPALAATVEAMAVAPAKLPAGTSPDGGSRAVIGVVDFGCDFAHKNLRLADGRTRLLALWHQAGVATTGSPFGYGRVYNRAEIDAALGQPDPYTALGYGPPVDPQGTHGTHVLDIAAGNGGGSGQPGVAPQADLLFAELAANDVPWSGPDAVGKTFGDSVQLLEAVRWIFDTAGDRPCVCNLSLGTNGGPHDGTSLVEQGLDAIVNEKPNRAIVIAASNSQADGIHASGRVGPGAAAHNLVWRQKVLGGGELEIWYPQLSRLEVTLVGPDGKAFGPIKAGVNKSFGTGGKIAVFISNRIGDPNNNDNVIGIWVAPGMPGSDWTVRLTSSDGKAVAYHAWLERDDNRQAAFATPVTTHCLGSISTGHQSIVVGSFDAHTTGYPISYFSSAGPTRDGREKPEISAPGHNVTAARSRTTDGVTRKSGTSMAAPAVSGLVALILSEARRTNTDLTIAQLRAKLTGVALHAPPPAGAWDAQYGNGRATGAAVK